MNVIVSSYAHGIRCIDCSITDLTIRLILLNLRCLTSFMSQHRQLSAILFTDIEGYTAIMQESEQAAMTLRHRHRQIIQEEHKNFNGRIIQYYGDGTLSTFQS